MSRFTQITASAGSGKTYRLTEDFLKLLRSCQESFSGSELEESGTAATFLKNGKVLDSQPDWKGILAITFTNKAAGEMRSRIVEKLKEIALGKKVVYHCPSCQNEQEFEAEMLRRGDIPHCDKCGGDLKLVWTKEKASSAIDAILHKYSSLNVRTIDSLLHLVVRLAALELNISPEFETTFDDGELSGIIFDELAEQALIDQESGGGMFRSACRHYLNAGAKGFLSGNSFREQTLLMASALMKSELRRFRFSNEEEIRNYEKKLQEYAGGLCRRFRESAEVLRDALDQQTAVKNFLVLLEKASSAESCDDIRNLKSAFLSKDDLENGCLKKSPGQSVIAKRFSSHYETLKQAYHEAAILKGALRILPFIRIGNHIEGKLRGYASGKGVVPSSIIPSLASQALDEAMPAGTLLCSLETRLLDIFIDEFQDTSRIQWEAMRPLVEEAMSNNGSLTIVGDVKQSIYGWRGADSSLFNEVARDEAITKYLDDADLDNWEPENLEKNWRSREDIISWNNAFFEPLSGKDFPREIFQDIAGEDIDGVENAADILAASFKDVRQKKSKNTKPGGYVRISRFAREKNAGESEDEYLRNEVLDLLDDLLKRYSPKKICILTRSNKQCQKAAEWLMAREDGPVIPVVTEGSLLIAEQPVIAELLSLMRFLTMPDDEPHFMAVLAGKTLLPCEFRTSLKEFCDKAAVRSRDTALTDCFKSCCRKIWDDCFEPLLEKSRSLTPYDLVFSLIEQWKVLSDHEDRAGVVRRFLEILHRAEQDGITDLAGFLEFWDGKGKEERVPVPESMDAVRIMTIHKAKGLEFPVVILPWMDFGDPKYSEKNITAYRIGGMDCLAPVCREMGTPWLDRLFKETRESLHLVYVAMTRAKSELYGFLPRPSKENGGFLSIINSMADKLIKAHGESATAEDEGVICWGTDPAEKASPAPGETDEFLKARIVSGPASPAENPTSSQQPVSAVLPLSPEKPAVKEDVRRQQEHPLSWMPALRLFRTPKDDIEEWSAKTRGTLIHHCLECLARFRTGDLRSSARLAAERGMETFPLPVPDKEDMLQKITKILEWYLSLDGAQEWLETGIPEKEIFDGKGNMFKIDLLADDGKNRTAVEYKTGTEGPLPSKEHVKQLKNYISLLEKAENRPAHGVLVYLDQRETFTF